MEALRLPTAKGTSASVGHLDGHIEDDLVVEMAALVGGHLCESMLWSREQLPIGSSDKFVATEDEVPIRTQWEGGRHNLTRDAQAEVARCRLDIHIHINCLFSLAPRFLGFPLFWLGASRVAIVLRGVTRVTRFLGFLHGKQPLRGCVPFRLV